MHPIAERLTSLIQQYGWEENFQAAIDNTQAVGIAGFPQITTLDDFLKQTGDLVTYTPSAGADVRNAFATHLHYYFILYQEPLRRLQNPIEPGESSVNLPNLVPVISRQL